MFHAFTLLMFVLIVNLDLRVLFKDFCGFKRSLQLVLKNMCPTAIALTKKVLYNKKVIKKESL